MAGNKNSGRRVNRDEKIRIEVRQISWELVLADLKNPDLDIAIKRDIYTKIILKDMPTELMGDLNANITMMGSIEKVGNIKETLIFNIGTPIGETDPTEDTGHTGQDNSFSHPI